MSSNINRLSNAVLYLLPFLCLVLFAVPHLNDTIISDEFDFFSSVKDLAASNSLYYFRAYIDERIIPQGGEEFQPWAYHPPLYVFTLAYLSKLFGVEVVLFRTFSLFCNLVVLSLIPIILKELFGKSVSREAIFAAMMLYVSTPLVLHSSLLLDIDNSLLLVFGLMIVYSLLRIYQTESVFSLQGLFAVLSIVGFTVLFILSKKTHYPAYFVGAILPAIFFRKYLKLIPVVAVTFLVSKFFSEYVMSVVEQAYSIDYDWAAKYTKVASRLRYSLSVFFNPKWFMLSWFRPIRVAFLGPAVPVIMLIFPVTLLFRYQRLRREDKTKESQSKFTFFALIAMYLMGSAIYLIMPGGYLQIPKYQIAVVPLLTMFFCFELNDEFVVHAKKIIYISLAAIIFSWVTIGDSLLRLSGADISIYPSESALILLCLLIVPVVLNRFYIRLNWNRSVVLGMFIATISYGFGANLRTMSEPGDVVYRYGFDKWNDVRQVVKENVEADEVFFGDPGIGYIVVNDRVVWDWIYLSEENLSEDEDGWVWVESSPGKKHKVGVFQTWSKDCRS